MGRKIRSPFSNPSLRRSVRYDRHSPVNYFVNGDFTNTLSTENYEYVSLDQMFTKIVSRPKPYQYVSPDRTLFIPAEDAFVQGQPYFGYKFAYILQAFGW